MTLHGRDARATKGLPMRIIGFSLLLAGWAIVLTAIVLLASPPSRAIFVLAGMAVETLGLVLVLRSHLAAQGERG